jgi:DDE_Tnp_1-associated
MARLVPTSIADHFRRLPDPRVRRTRRHALVDILVITLCAAICGADDWVAIARFGRAKRKWFREFLTLRHGIPSHDTFGRVFAALDPEAFCAWAVPGRGGSSERRPRCLIAGVTLTAAAETPFMRPIVT